MRIRNKKDILNKLIGEYIIHLGEVIKKITKSKLKKLYFLFISEKNKKTRNALITEPK